MTEIVHVGEGGRKSKAPRMPFVVVFIAALLFAGGAGVFVRWIQDKDQGAAATLPELPAAVSKAQDLQLAGRPDEAQRKITEALDNPATSSDTKYTLNMQLGALLGEKSEWQAALDAYTKANTIKETRDSILALASTYQQLGDKQNAITYYKKAIQLIPQDDPIASDEIQLLEEQIKALGGQP